MNEKRADPDELLRVITKEEKCQKRGHLKIYFGYAAGVGKTYAMLRAAHAAQRQGIDTVIGYIEPHGRPQTAALEKGLESIPPKEILYNTISLHEFDIDAALERHPRLVLVDELAHTNAPGCRHKKRYQDVEELLRAGIDVYTTINVQHIESLCDVVASITGVVVQERIPDKVFDNADQVKLVDIEPQELIQRLHDGKIYREGQAQKALSNFFSIENLTALREIALRRCADRINKLSGSARLKSNSDYYTDEHILVCLSSSPTAPKIIRTAARMAKAFRGGFTALFVETPDFPNMSEGNRNRLRNNIHLAEQLGASIETVYGDDIALQIAEFARFSGISKIVLGRSNAKRKYFFSKPTLTEKLIAYAPNLDIYIIPDTETSVYTVSKCLQKREKFHPADLLKSALLLAAATLLGYLFQSFGFSEANIIIVYILAVLLTALVTTGRSYSLVSSVVSVLLFNFCFIDPRFTLKTYGSGYPATFAIMFLSAFITSDLAVKLKRSAKASAQSAYRTKVLLDANRILQQEKGSDGIIEATSNQLIKLLQRDIAFYPTGKSGLAEPALFPAEGNTADSMCVTENEKAVASWVFKNNKHAGATTGTLSNAKYLYLAVRINSQVYGVVGIHIGKEPLDSFENSIVLSILGECALALENEKVAAEKEEAAVLAKNEQLRANLLRSISHDLRTPLTSISGSADMLLTSEQSLSAEQRHQLYSDMYDDSLWLINLVENLLSVTKIEEGTMNLRFKPELLDDLVAEALRHINRKSAEHHISVRHSSEFIMVRVDARLIVQVIINLVDNAIKYTQKDSHIEIHIAQQGEKAIVEVSDDGPGISDNDKPRIFDMFYTANVTVADSRRSLGLGLSLCKSIINAHNGEISVSDNVPHGTVFRFTLPTEEVTLHE